MKMAWMAGIVMALLMGIGAIAYAQQADFQPKCQAGTAFGGLCGFVTFGITDFLDNFNPDKEAVAGHKIDYYIEEQLEEAQVLEQADQGNIGGDTAERAISQLQRVEDNELSSLAGINHDSPDIVDKEMISGAASIENDMTSVEQSEGAVITTETDNGVVAGDSGISESAASSATEGGETG